MNMKNNYIKPSVKVAELETSSLLAGSTGKAPGWDPEYQAGIDPTPGTEDDFE